MKRIFIYVIIIVAIKFWIKYNFRVDIMLKKSKTGKILIPMLLLVVTLFFYILPTGSANEDDKQLNDSKYDEKNWHAPLPDYGPEFFDEIRKDPRFVASRGSFPETTNDDENVDLFSNPVYKCWSNITEIDQFFTEFDDIVIGTSYAGAGYIIVELESDSSEKVNETTIDKICQIVNNYCEQEGVSEVPVIFMWSHIEEDLPLPDYGPESFDKAKNETGFITTRGTMPEIYQEEEKRKWLDLLINYSRSLSLPNSTTGINPYFAEFGGPVISFGTNINGYLIVGFEAYTPEKVNESVINEVYQVIDEDFEQEGISDVPVVFVFDHITLTEGAPTDGPDADEEVITIIDENGNAIDVNKNKTYIDKDGNLAIIDNETTQETNKPKQKTNETTNQMPGFTSVMVTLGLLFLLIIKRS